jgi:hypothetical protein
MTKEYREMTTVSSEILRSAAQRLTSLDASLPARVEAQIQLKEAGQTTPPSQYEPVSIALAGLLVSVATLAWTIYADLRKSHRSPDPGFVERRVRVETEKLIPLGITDQNRDLLIKTVVEETVRHVEQKP